MSEKPAQRPQLRQEEQLWITAEINQPSWNFISGFVFFFFSAGLVYTVVTSPLSGTTKLVAGLASLLVAVPGFYFIKIGAAKIMPLRRLRQAVTPHAHLETAAIAGHSPEVLLLELEGGNTYLITGPAVNYLAQVNVLHGAQKPDDLSVDFFAEPDTSERDNQVPIRLHISDHGSAVGYAEWYGKAA